MRGARIDLRDTGIRLGEIDLSRAYSDSFTKQESPNTEDAGARLYCALRGPSTAANDPCVTQDTVRGPPTFLLSGGASHTGIGTLPRSTKEDGILYISFNFGTRPSGFNFPVMGGVTAPDNILTGSWSAPDGGFNGRRGTGDSVERFAAFEISIRHKTLDVDHSVYVMTSSSDPDDTLYVVPVLMGDDSAIEEDERAEIKVEGVAIGRKQNGDPTTAMVASGATAVSSDTGFDLEYLYDRNAILDGYDDDYEDVLRTASDTVLVEDDDEPQYPACDRHPQVIAAIETELMGQRCRRIALDDLAKIARMSIYPGAPDIDDPLEAIYYSDLEGLTGLEFLDLGGNNLRDLPSNALRDVGVGKSNRPALIDMRFNTGRRTGSDGFVPSDLGSSLRLNLQHLQIVRVDNDLRGQVGFDRERYLVNEGGVLVFQVRSNGSPNITFTKESGDTASDNPDQDCNAGVVLPTPNRCHLPYLPGESNDRLNLATDFQTPSLNTGSVAGAGTYVIAVKMPFTGDTDRDDETFTLTLDLAEGKDPTAAVTIRDATSDRGTRSISTSSPVYQQPRRTTPTPTPRQTVAFDYISFVTANEYVVAPNNPDLRHNIPDLSVNIDGRTVTAGFLSHYRNTGGLERWGYPTSEVLVLENGTLTQFYQRGAVDFHNVGAGWVVERRLVWDYVGGGLGGSTDQGVESGPFNSNPGTLLGPWGNRVANVSMEGTNVGFADFFNRLGGVMAFGFPKTEARTDIDRAGRLLGPGQTPGFIRQYFQAAIFEFHPNDRADPVKLALLGDTLRDLLVRDHASQPGFAAAGRLLEGVRYVPAVVS